MRVWRAIDYAGDATLLTNQEGKVLFASRAALDLIAAHLGEAAAQIGEASEPLLAEVLPQAVAAIVEQHRHSGARTHQVEWQVDGNGRVVEARVTNLQECPGVEGALLVCTDRSAERALHEALAFQAFHDELTGLAGRALLLDRLEQALMRAQRGATGVVVVAFADLDGFKAINDHFGHAAADQLLVQVARSLRTRMRRTDTCARLGGDEFVVVGEVASTADAEAFGQHVLAAAQVPAILDEAQHLRWSVGVAVGGSDAARLLAAADAAMYEAKRAGGNRLRLAPLGSPVAHA